MKYQGTDGRKKETTCKILQYYLTLLLFLQVEVIGPAKPTQTTNSRVPEENDGSQAVAGEDSSWMQCVSCPFMISQIALAGILNYYQTLVISSIFICPLDVSAMQNNTCLSQWCERKHLAIAITNDSHSHSSLTKHSIRRLHWYCSSQALHLILH